MANRPCNGCIAIQGRYKHPSSIWRKLSVAGKLKIPDIIELLIFERKKIHFNRGMNIYYNHFTISYSAHERTEFKWEIRIRNGYQFLPCPVAPEGFIM